MNLKGLRNFFFDFVFKKSVLELKFIHDRFYKSRFKTLIFFLSLVVLVFWQTSFPKESRMITSEYGRQDASGFTHHYGKNFTYFYYYLGYFPLATTNEPLDYSVKGAENEIKNHPDSLLMEWAHWARLGENLKIIMYLPDMLLKGNPKDPSIIPFNKILFIISLCALLTSFYFNGYFFLGCFLVLFFGSNPFLLFENYYNENFFGLMASCLIILLSLNLCYFNKVPDSKAHWILPVISGFIIGSAVNIRAETNVLIVCIIFIYLSIIHTKWITKGLLIGILVISFLTTKKIWISHFENKFDQTYALVKSHGGNVFNGERIKAHTFWHPFFCGLGDFDTKYGYEWEDRVAYKYALPILKAKYGIHLKWNGDLKLDEYFDKQKKYYRKIELIPEYEEIMKEKVLHDIKNDPVWFINIISHRIWYVFKYTSPIWISLANFNISIPFSGFLLFPLLYLFYRKKLWFHFKLILFSLPLATTSILIFAKKNSTYNSCFHIFCVSFIFIWLLEIVINWYFGRNKQNA